MPEGGICSVRQLVKPHSGPTTSSVNVNKCFPIWLNASHVSVVLFYEDSCRIWDLYTTGTNTSFPLCETAWTRSSGSTVGSHVGSDAQIDRGDVIMSCVLLLAGQNNPWGHEDSLLRWLPPRHAAVLLWISSCSVWITFLVNVNSLVSGFSGHIQCVTVLQWHCMAYAGITWCYLLTANVLPHVHLNAAISIVRTGLPSQYFVMMLPVFDTVIFWFALWIYICHLGS